MAIKKFYSTKAKAGWKLDRATNKYWSYGFDIYLESGKRKRESCFATKDLASSAIARIKISEKEGKYNLQRRKFSLVSEILQKRVLRIDGKKEKKRATVIFNRWLSLLAPNLRFNELTTALIRLFVDERAAEVKASSVARELTYIASAIHHAHEDFSELENLPLPKIPRPKVEKSNRERVINRDEVERVLFELYRPPMEDEKRADYVNRRRVGLIFHFELLTGSRKGEVENVLISGVDYFGGEVQVRGSKTRYTSQQIVRYVPLTQTLRRVIEEAGELNKGDYVFTVSGSPTKNHYKFMKEACKRAGVKYGREVTGGLVGHDARHTFVTRSTQAGKDLATVGSITGHADKTLALRYSHASRESRAALTDIAENFAVWDFDDEFI